MITAYLAMAYRGVNGDRAEEDEIQANIRQAKRVAIWLEKTFGKDINLFVPHEHSEILHILWRNKQLTSQQIIDACCQWIAEHCQLLLVCQPITEGMQKEIETAQKKGIEIVIFDNTKRNFFTVRQKIAQAIKRAYAKKA